MSLSLLDRLSAVLDGADDADDALRETVTILSSEPDISWAGITFLDEGERTPGPTSGVPDVSPRTTTAIVYETATVGELLVDGTADPALLERIASLVAAHVLIGWDTGGEAWEP